MGEMTVGVRELKARLSAYLRRVKRGETLLITEHGQPVGRIMPVNLPLEERMLQLVNAGLAAWDGQKLKPIQPVAENHGDRAVSDLLVEMRE